MLCCSELCLFINHQLSAHRQQSCYSKVAVIDLVTSSNVIKKLNFTTAPGWVVFYDCLQCVCPFTGIGTFSFRQKNGKVPILLSEERPGLMKWSAAPCTNHGEQFYMPSLYHFGFISSYHDAIKWKLFHVTGCEGNPLVTGGSPHKVPWRRALMFSLICAWTNSFANNRDAGDLRYHHAHYEVNVMSRQPKAHP